MTDVHWLNLLTLIFKTHMRSYTEKVSGDPNKIFCKKNNRYSTFKIH